MRKCDGDCCPVEAAGVTAGTEMHPALGRALAEDLSEASGPRPHHPSLAGTVFTGSPVKFFLTRVCHLSGKTAEAASLS